MDAGCENGRLEIRCSEPHAEIRDIPLRRATVPAIPLADVDTGIANAHPFVAVFVAEGDHAALGNAAGEWDKQIVGETEPPAQPAFAHRVQSVVVPTDVERRSAEGG